MLITKNQTFIILTPSNQADLSEFLAKGWRITQTCPMPSSTNYYQGEIKPTCLVILEK